MALGVESGSPQILELLGKPSQPDRVVELIARLKGADIAVSVILMLGVGGRQGASAHEQETLDLLRRLPLAGEDRIYLSELLIYPQSATESGPAGGSALGYGPAAGARFAALPARAQR